VTDKTDGWVDGRTDKTRIAAYIRTTDINMNIYICD